MNISVETEGSVVVVAPSGPHLDASVSDEFKNRMSSLLEKHRRILIDMSALRFVDSSGLGSILSCVRRLSASGGELKVCGLAAQVRSVFELTRMNRIIDIQPDRKSALAAFGNA